MNKNLMFVFATLALIGGASPKASANEMPACNRTAAEAVNRAFPGRLGVQQSNICRYGTSLDAQGKYAKVQVCTLTSSAAGSAALAETFVVTVSRDCSEALSTTHLGGQSHL